MEKKKGKKQNKNKEDDDLLTPLNEQEEERESKEEEQKEDHKGDEVVSIDAIMEGINEDEECQKYKQMLNEAEKMKKKKGNKKKKNKEEEEDDSYVRPKFDLLTPTPVDEQEEGKETEEEEQEKEQEQEQDEVVVSIDAILEAINEEECQVNAPINPWYCEDDCAWDIDDEKPFKSYFMKRNYRQFSNLSRKEKDVIDFCFFGHKEKDVRFNIFAHDGTFFIYFPAIATLDQDRYISNNVIDTWSLLLNKAEAFYANRDDNVAYRFFYSSQHSHYLEELLNPKNDQVKEDRQSSLHSCWNY